MPLFADVVGYEDLYSVTDDGRVWSKRRGKFLSAAPNSSGYPQVVLCDRGRRASLAVHSLVLEAFVEKPFEGAEVAHGDGDQTNNCLSNLRWVARVENAKDRCLHGRSGLKITRAIAEQIRSTKGTQRGVAELFGVSQSLVGRIKTGTLWSW